VASTSSPSKSTPTTQVTPAPDGPEAPAPIRVALAMASHLDRMAWSIVIGNQEDMELIAAPGSSQQLLKALDAHSPHVVLVDEAMLEQFDRSSLRALQKRLPSFRLILVAMHQKDYSLEPTRFPFIHTRLLKGVSAPELLETIRAAA
jgi:DNA-binding NarL/FixJ family response regulator